MVLTDIVANIYENLSEDETESIRQDLAARINIAGIARREAAKGAEESDLAEDGEEIEHESDAIPGRMDDIFGEALAANPTARVIHRPAWVRWIPTGRPINLT
jgi:hypothetical protein